MPTTDYRYAVNDALTALAQRFDAAIPDEPLNELTHHVADVLDEYRNRETAAPADPEPVYRITRRETTVYAREFRATELVELLSGSLADSDTDPADLSEDVLQGLLEGGYARTAEIDEVLERVERHGDVESCATKVEQVR